MGSQEQANPAYKGVIEEMCDLKWSSLSQDGLINVAWAYYHFSTHFRECIEAALRHYPNDKKLQELDRGERNTDNLSPYPGVAEPGEKLNHEEFMRRTLTLTPIPESRRKMLEALGQTYLAKVRAIDEVIRVTSLSAYEDGGLEAVFRSILKAPHWDGAMLGAFRHFLVGHVALDSDQVAGHSVLSRHIKPDDRILPLWTAFRDIFVEAAPELRG